jgi:hypothetical protein
MGEAVNSTMTYGKNFGKCHDVSKYNNNKKNAQKGLAEWLKWQSTCLASVRPTVQTLIPPKKCTGGENLLYMGMSMIMIAPYAVFLLSATHCHGANSFP